MKSYTTTDGYEEVVDLDNLDTYPSEWRSMEVHDLFLKCMSEAGESLFYMEFLHSDITDWEPQRGRVKVLCEELSNIWHNVRIFKINEDEYRLALMSWLFRFQDETENQC